MRRVGRSRCARVTGGVLTPQVRVPVERGRGGGVKGELEGVGVSNDVLEGI